MKPRRNVGGDAGDDESGGRVQDASISMRSRPSATSSLGVNKAHAVKVG